MDEIEQRKKKLEALIKAGVEPYGRKFPRTHTTKDLRQRCASLITEKKEVAVAGRIILLRRHGKAAFVDLRDFSGQIQAYFKKDTLADAYEIFENLDIGDFIGIRGELFKTKTEELTVAVTSLTVLCKALYPLPEKWHGLKDTEMKYRMRYLDLLANEKSRQVFDVRTRLINAMREFLNSTGFCEVETPMLQPMAGGAAGKPFQTHLDSLDMELFLRIAPELYLKRLLVGGYEKIYEINRSFRNEGISTRHNPEFTMLEAYWAYSDYEDMMQLTETLVQEVTKKVLGKNTFSYNGREIDITPPWRRITFSEVMKEKFQIDIESENQKTLREKLIEAGVKIEGETLSRTRLINLMDEFLTAEEPTFVTDYPIEITPLAKSKPGKPHLAERFELFIGGLELANAYSELNDPNEQGLRFRKSEHGEGAERDSDFILALKYGMPPASGLGVGVDRLLMLLTDTRSIRDVILFPQLKGIAQKEAHET